MLMTSTDSLILNEYFHFKTRRKSLFGNLVSGGSSNENDQKRLEHLSELIHHIEIYYAAVQESPSSPIKKSGRKSLLNVESITSNSPSNQDLDALFTNVVLKTYRVHGIEQNWPHRGPSHVLDALELFIEKFPGYKLQFEAAQSEKQQDQPNISTDLGQLVGGPEVNISPGHSKAVSDIGGAMEMDHQELSAHLRAPSARNLLDSE